MKLKVLLNGIEDLKAKGNLDVDVQNIESDSRKVTENTMFVAITGFQTDGHKYIDQAIKNGATVVAVEKLDELKKCENIDNVTVIVAPDTRVLLARVAINFYGKPSSKFKLVGITGTKGKTTTSFMIKEILEASGKKVGLIGTIATYIGNKKLQDSDRTTPESLELQRLFSQMVEEKVDVVVMEVSSQSLKLHRVDGCEFDIGIFTNFSEDHISNNEHPDMEDYFNSKMKLLDMCKTAYINTDDYTVAKIKKMDLKCEVKTYGVDNSANLLAKDITITNASVDFKVKIGEKNERIKVGIPGRFSVYNSLAAISVAVKMGVDAETIKNAVLEIKVPGRSELVPNKQGMVIMLDYAHSPESLEKILLSVKNYTRGRVISVFGCGGDRDTNKRPIMGEISGKIADFTIITSDNPRTEEPKEIINQIEQGIKKTKGNYITIVDRTEAIKHAIKIYKRNDIIVLAGKGHETYQEINHEKHHYDEREIIKDILK